MKHPSPSQGELLALKLQGNSCQPLLAFNGSNERSENHLEATVGRGLLPSSEDQGFPAATVLAETKRTRLRRDASELHNSGGCGGPSCLLAFEDTVRENTGTYDTKNICGSSSPEAPMLSISELGRPFKFHFSCRTPPSLQAQPTGAIERQVVFTAADVSAAMILFGLRANARVFRIDDIADKALINRSITPESSHTVEVKPVNERHFPASTCRKLRPRPARSIHNNTKTDSDSSVSSQSQSPSPSNSPSPSPSPPLAAMSKLKTEEPPNHVVQAKIHRCEWPGCTAQLGIRKKDVKHHIREHIVNDLGHRVVGDTSVSCKACPTSRPMRLDTVLRHYAEKHFLRDEKAICRWCGLSFISRTRELYNHWDSCLEKTGHLELEKAVMV